MGVRVKGLGGWVMITLLSVTSLAAANDLRLVEAVKRGDKKTMRSLLTEQADVNSHQADGATALAWAAHRNDLETADLLIRAGANVDAANDYGVTPLALACTNRNAAMVEKLLEAGADPNAVQWTGESVLMTCARAGSVDAVKSLLISGANVNVAENRKGQTALMWAVAQKHPDAVRALVAKGADVNARSRVLELPKPLVAVTYSKDVHFPKRSGGVTPLMFAARAGALDSARILLEAGANVNETPEADGIGDGSALVVASASGHEKFALFLLKQGADPNATDRYGITPLHWAMQEGLRALVGGGAKPTDRFWYHSNMPELVKALLAKGADPNLGIRKDFPPYDNMLFGHTLGNGLPQITLVSVTPFLLAAGSGDIGAMRVLVEGRADPKLATVDSTTPVMAAAGVGRERQQRTAEALNNFIEAAKLAVLLGGDVNAVNREGRTALHGAAALGDTEMIQFLVEQGAHLEAKDMYGQTPLSIALGDPEGLVYRQLPGDAFDYRFRRPRVQAKVAEFLVKLGAIPFTGEFRDRSGE